MVRASSGRSIQTGEPRRVDRDEAQREVDRRVDRQLGFQTRNLLCVPLRSPRGDLFGAFEMLNKVGGDFTDDDQTALTELAAHAAVALDNTPAVRKAAQGAAAFDRPGGRTRAD